MIQNIKITIPADKTRLKRAAKPLIQRSPGVACGEDGTLRLHSGLKARSVKADKPLIQTLRLCSGLKARSVKADKPLIQSLSKDEAQQTATNSQKIFLSALLKAHDVVLDSQKPSIIQIQISPYVCCTLIDDLALVSSVKQHINIVLAHDSNVDYLCFHHSVSSSRKCHPEFISGSMIGTFVGEWMLKRLQHDNRSSEVEPAKSAFEKHIKFVFEGEHAQGHIFCAYHAKSHDSLNLTVVQDHCAADTISSCMIKSVLVGNAQIRATCLIKTHKHCSRVKAEQMSKTLMLGWQARCVVIPQLEIEDYESECRHGASISSISEEDLFYLQSRGIGEEKAKKLLVDAFLSGSK